MKIKRGDKVKVIAGENKGSEGIVKKTFPKLDKVIIEGVNSVKIHKKPNQNQTEGTIIEREAPIHISNVALIDPKTKGKKTTITKIGYKMEDGKKVRYARKTGTILK